VPSLADIIAALDEWYPPSTAEKWDAVGLTCGDPAGEVDRILLAVDCVPATIEEAIGHGADLLVTHHPLLLTALHSVAVTDPKGAMVHRMIRDGVAHFAVHTNADIARYGVSEALAETLGLEDLRPLDPDPAAAVDHLAVFVPAAALDALIHALSAAGAGRIGNYDECTFTVEGTGTFRPLDGADPADGEVGVLSRVPEVRLSMELPRGRREAVIAAMRQAHPYEEVAFELTERARLNSDIGTGRVGSLPQPMSLAEFTRHVAQRLPKTEWGVRSSGDPEKPISTVAVCGGSGGSYADRARSAGADVYVTSDLKHHSTLEAVAERPGAPMALVDAAHFATEAPWLAKAAGLLADRFGDSVTIDVSALVTDPWTLHEH